nr:hypothetical protein [Tanacetum cinerariifolium]
SHGLKRLYKVGLSARVESSADEESLGEEDASKQGRISDIDANQEIYLVNAHRVEDIFGDELKQESSKKQKIEDENESAKLKRCLEIVPDDRDKVTIDATHLSTKSPTIVDYMIYKEGRKSFF